MKTIVLAVILSSSAAFAVATWVYSPANPQSISGLGSSSSAILPDAERLAVLERAVSDERIARQFLQEEVWYLTETLDSLQSTALSEIDNRSSHNSDERTSMTSAEQRELMTRRYSPEGRIDHMVKAGLDPGLATWIVQREQEIQMESLQARYEAGRNGDMTDFYRQQASQSDILRQELGDDGYEQYLTANQRSISVAISSVISSSPAQFAGLRPGDEIMRYAGARVFSMTDINRAMMQGDAGQSVVVDFVRDGIPMQLVIPRGPLGVTGGRTRR